jgi:hypothetical protein
MKWFGSEWGASVCDPETWIKTPVGAVCIGCGYMVKSDHRGILVPASGHPASLENTDGFVFIFGSPHAAYHLGCLLDVVVGPRLGRNGALRDDVDPSRGGG